MKQLMNETWLERTKSGLFWFFIVGIGLFYPIIKANSQEPILTNAALFREADKSLRDKNYRKAEVYLYALIQRNTEQYKMDQKLNWELNAALKTVRNNRDLIAGVGATHDQVSPLGYSYGQLVGGSAVNNFTAGTYKDNLGVVYVINKIGSQVWWTSSNELSTPTIMHGKQIGNYIFAEWSYMPGYKLGATGMIKFRITNPRTLTVETSTGANFYRGTVFRLQ
ncbi:hypothetical protein [Flavitalea sp.]|nr:hypothetical protein [Flavitalea sp.]